MVHRRKTKAIFFACCFLHLLSVVCPVRGVGAAGRITHVFVVDVSLSMVGRGSGATDIMDKVKDAVKGYMLDEEPLLGCNIIVATFSDGMKSFQKWSSVDTNDLKEIRECVDNIQATGYNTWVSTSMREIFRAVDAQRKGEDPVCFFVYTDGMEEEPGKTIGDMVREFRAVRGERDWLYYFALGVSVPPGDQGFFTPEEHAYVLPVISGQSPPVVVEVMIPRLNFGNLADGAVREQAFNPRFRPKDLENLMLSFTVLDGEVSSRLREQGAYVTLSPKEHAYGDTVGLSLSVVNPESVVPGAYVLPCKVESRDPSFVLVNNFFEASFYAGDLSYSAHFGREGEQEAVLLADRVWEREFSGEMCLTIEPSPLVRSMGGAGLSWATVESEGDVRACFQDGGSKVTLPPLGGQVPLTVTVPRGTPSGKYLGKVTVHSEDAVLKGSSVELLGDSSYGISFKVHVLKKPLTPGLKASVGLGIGLLAGSVAVFVTAAARQISPGTVLEDWANALKLSRPRIQNLSVYRSQPRGLRGSCEFPGLREELIGPGTLFLSDMPFGLRLRAGTFRGQKTLTVTSTDPSRVFGLRRPGEKDFTPHREALVTNGDIIDVGGHTLRIESTDWLGGV